MKRALLVMIAVAMIAGCKSTEWNKDVPAGGVVIYQGQNENGSPVRVSQIKNCTITEVWDYTKGVWKMSGNPVCTRE